MAGSFFLGCGYMQADVTGKLKVTSTNSSDVIVEKTNYQSHFATFNIGNVWSFKGIHMGGEWIGYSRILDFEKSVTDESTETTESGMETARDKFHSKLRGYAENNGLNLLIIYFGISL